MLFKKNKKKNQNQNQNQKENAAAPGKTGKEKREHDRFELLQASYFRKHDDASDVFDCMIHNLSDGGVYMESQESIEPGTHIVLLFNLAGKVLRETLVIVRHEIYIGNHFYGCAFLEPASPDRKKAMELFQEIQFEF